MTPDQSLLDLSDTLFSITVALYSVALVAFCAQLAFGRRPAQARQLVAAGAAGTPGGRAADDADLAGPRRAQRWGAVAIGLTVLGALAHAGVLLCRGLALDRLPWGNMYEFATAVVLVAVIAYVVLAVRSPALRHIGVFVLAPVVLGMVAIGLFLYVEGGPLIAALRSSWLAIHVSTAIIGFGIFLVSGIASVLYLVRSKDEQKPAEERGAGFVARLPESSVLDRLAHRTAVFGFPIWTFAVIAGAIWAESAWGRFWGWDPKETWSFIAWVVYAAYLHARTTAGWRGRPAAWVNVIGLVVMIFNLTFVNLVSSGLHSYAGVE
ncbi:c-type cytochrome biogenesis protein CcsB [Blastococcus goldschmidtiae]|uniref:C-type cytochrome biogenesis protein CcsB n=1 Tax=Blastococcus goldschmidtiae TaxID=3075546 RepID=A0ABU2K3X8_9ACTN|nr:c-type cytochrome biogenesis protein CcsB [Blastococcus sp. DSM 46792]MDT0274865.1 c-type cytochrome biogenesis protein CcsB [Blastococcus sp. DSM 46792]